MCRGASFRKKQTDSEKLYTKNSPWACISKDENETLKKRGTTMHLLYGSIYVGGGSRPAAARLLFCKHFVLFSSYAGTVGSTKSA